MKKLLLIFLFFVSLIEAKAQDKIITIKKDTIECRIVSVNAERIGYEQMLLNKQIVGNSIAVSDVLQYFRTGKLNSLGGNTEKPKRERPPYCWIISLQSGLSHSLTDYENYGLETDDYIKKLKNGYHLNASLHCLLTNFFGLGVDYNLFYSASKFDVWAQGYGGMNLPMYNNVKLDDRLYNHFIGPSVLFQQFPDKNKRLKISETISPGIVFFRGESRGNEYQEYWGDKDSYYGELPHYYLQANSVAKSTSFGAKGGVSIDYVITPQLSAGLSGNFIWAKLYKLSVKSLGYEKNNQKLEKSINISHIDYGFTVRYNF